MEFALRTGADVLESNELSVHVKAVITGATAVFTQDLCRDMFTLQAHVEENQMPIVARACACRIMKGDKCAQLEALVTAVIDSPDGMPEVDNQPLLREVLAVYSDTAHAERNGHAAQFRQQQLIPGIIENAYQTSGIAEQDAGQFIERMQEYADEWDSFQPCTAFQQIVVDAINKICI